MTTTTRTIFVCKACKKAGRPGFVRAVETDSLGYTLDKHGVRLPLAQQGGWETIARCPTCNRLNNGSPVKGRVTAHECNAKCMASTSGICECSCGGKNHGGSYL